MAIDAMTGMAIGQGAGGLVGGLANLFGGSGDDPAQGYLLQSLELLQQIQDPAFDFSDLTAPQLQFIAEVDPQTYEARVPEEVKIIAESEARASEERALMGLEDIATGGIPLVDRLAEQSAVEAIAGEAGAAQEGVLSDLAGRGRLGGGTEVQARLEADRDLNSLRATIARELAQDRALRRMDAIGASGQLAGQIRGGDIAREAENAAMINRMNQFIGSLQTDAERFAAQQETANRVREAEGRQRVSDVNRLTAYDVDRENIERRNALQEAIKNFQLRRAGHEVSALGDFGTSRRLERASRERNIENILGSAGGLVGGLAGGGAFTPTPSAGTAVEDPRIRTRKEIDDYFAGF